jgi:tyrosine-specific transport protein
MQRLDSKLFGGTMLIAGTSIGAAMLAMPILTGLFGFIGTLIIMIACWLFMYWTALLILEASLQFTDEASFVTMARSTLGHVGAGITWVTFLLLFYALVAAYLNGSGSILLDAVERFLHVDIPPFFDLLPLLILFAPFIYFGLSIVDHLNRYLMIGMFIAYIAISFWLMPHVHMENLSALNWKFSLLSFSVVVTSFGYHVIIPSLATYLDRDVVRVKKCLFYGSLIPLIIYFFWEFSILGSVPLTGDYGLMHAFKEDMPLAKVLRIQLGNDLIAVLAQAFSIFAIVTSFLGVAQGLFDFLKDGLHAKKSKQRRILAFVLTFLPPIAFILFFRSGFIATLEYAGALVSIILGIIPILMVIALRKTSHKKIIYRAPGNTITLYLAIVFFACVVLIVVLKNFKIISFV